MNAKFHQLIATSLATCLTICQIPAWAQVQGQRPKILNKETQAKKIQPLSKKDPEVVVINGKRYRLENPKSKEADQDQLLLAAFGSPASGSENRMIQPTPIKPENEMKITHFDLPENGKVQAKVTGRSTTLETKPYSSFDSDLESEVSKTEVEVMVAAATKSGIIFSAMGSSATSVEEDQNEVETTKRSGVREPVFSAGYKIQNTEGSQVFGMVSYSPKINAIELSEKADGVLEADSLNGRDELGFGGGAATRSSNIIIGGSLMLYLVGERELTVKSLENSGRPATVTGTGGNYGRLEGFIEFPSQFTIGGLYRIEGYEDEEFSSQSSLATVKVDAYNVYTLAGYGSIKATENLLLRGALMFVRSSQGKEASVDGSGLDLGLRYQF